MKKHSKNILPFSVAILAGGKSSRMGEPKAWLEIENEPIINRTIEIASRITNELIIVSGEDYKLFETPKAKIVTDQIKGKGPLMAIFTALQSISNSHCLILACDLPLITERILIEMGKKIGSHDAVVPLTDNGFEPLCAIYAQSCSSTIESRINQNKLSVHRIFSELNIYPFTEWSRFDPSGNIFLNMNTKDDYQKARQILAKSSSTGTKYYTGI